MGLKLALWTALVVQSIVMAAATPMSTGFKPRYTNSTIEIVGGTEATRGEFPYIVSLSSGGSHSCGGALLNANTVLTAGHCSVDTSPSSVEVRAGTLTWASGGTQVGVSTINVHPDYNANKIDNDIALWHLSEPIEEAGDIGYVTLPEQGSDPEDGSTATVAGWGLLTENGSTLPSTLYKVSVPVISRSECQQEYGSGDVTDNMFCAGLDEGGKDACSGDSGGPIIDADSGTLIGLVSWGQGCAEAGYPGVYARVGNYVDYITENKWTS